MALGYLFILFVVLSVVSLLSIITLYTSKNENFKNIVFYFVCIWSLMITYMNFTSLPTNYLVSRLISCLFGLLAIISIIIKIKMPNKKDLSYLLASVSTLLGLSYLFFF